MAIRATNRYGVPYYYDTVAGPLPGASVFENAPMAAFFSDPSAFTYYHNDFTELTIASNTFGGWAFTQATTGTITQDTTASGGILKLSAGAVTAGQGVNWELNNVPFAVAAGKPVWYETRLKVTGLSTTPKVQFFAGLAVTSTALIAANAIADVDMIAYQGVSTTGVILATTHNGAGLVTTGTGLTIADATWYRLGFIAETTGVRFYVNGALVSTLTTNIPTAALAPAFVMQANATVTPVMNIDSIRVLGYK